MNMKNIILLSFLFNPILLLGQFFLNGDAIVTNDSCYQLTYETDFSSGSIWNETKINLNQSFDVIMQVYLGCKDGNGADGIVFGFQPVSTSIGMAGGGIGFENIVPSLGIEIDTWQNNGFSDPSYDHLAIIQNGNLNHGSSGTLAGPIQANATNPNIENCNFHDLRVTWDANNNTLDVYFDCELRLSYTGNIVDDIFNGDPEVFWGFTSATGGANNIHSICFTYTTFLDNLQDVVMCPGGSLRLEARGGVRYEWSPTEGLSNPTIARPIVAPTETTHYTVTIYDECDQAFMDELTVFVEGDSVFFDLGLDTALCQGESLVLDVTNTSSEYEWSTGATSPDIEVFNPGTYAVTVTKTDTFCIADDEITVRYLPLPQANLGQDTSLCLGQEITVSPHFLPADYLWQDGATDLEYTIRETGVYEVAVTNECGTVTDAIFVEVEDCTQVYFPSAFSPNFDGKNDYFLIQDDGDVEKIVLLRIFDRWGELVFEAEDFKPNLKEFAWDGMQKGQLMNSGVFVYYAEVLFRDGSEEIVIGELVLLN